MRFDGMSSDKCFDVVQLLASVTSTKKKLELMGAGLKPVLWWTYHPDLTFGLRKIYTTGVGRKEFDEQTYRLLNVLAKRRLTGKSAEDTTVTYTRTLTEKSGELFKMLVERDLRCGISRGLVEKKFPGLLPIYEHMKPMDYDPTKVVTPCYVATKKNGIRAFYENGRFYTRKGKLIHGMDHIIREMKNNGIIHKVDGEMVVPGVSFEKGTGMIRSREPTPQAFFWVFGLPLSPLRYYKTRKIMQSLFGLTSTCRWLPDYEVNSIHEIDEFYDSTLSRGEEGIVIKTRNHKYINGESWDWMKRKETFSLDLEIVDVYEGNGKYRDSLGGIIVRLNDTTFRNSKRVRVGSGFSDPERRSWFASPDTILGRTAEILFKERTPTGSLRDPRFVRLRWDK